MKNSKLSTIRPSTINCIFEFIGIYESALLGQACQQTKNLFEKFVSFKSSMSHFVPKHEENFIFNVNKIEKIEQIEREVKYFTDYLDEVFQNKPDDLKIDIMNINTFKDRDKTPIFTREICDNLLKNYPIVSETRRKDEEIILFFAIITYILKFSKLTKDIEKELLIPVTYDHLSFQVKTLFNDFPDKVTFLQYNDNHSSFITRSLDFLHFLNHFEGININIFFSNDVLKLVYQSIIYNSKLHYLTVNNNDSDKRIINILSLLSLKDSVIKSRIIYLNLSHNNLGEQAYKAISALLVSSEIIESLVLKSNKIQNESLHNLSLALTKNKSLKYLDLSFNRFDSLGMKYLSEALVINDSVRILYLASNILDRESMKFLSFCLKFNSTLKILNLGSCKIDDHSGGYAAKLIKRNRGLVHINLRHNLLSDNSLKAVLNSIVENSSLEEIDLSSNYFSDGYYLNKFYKDLMLVKKTKLRVCLQSNYFKFTEIDFDFINDKTVSLLELF